MLGPVSDQVEKSEFFSDFSTWTYTGRYYLFPIIMHLDLDDCVATTMAMPLGPSDRRAANPPRRTNQSMPVTLAMVATPHQIPRFRRCC